MPGYGTGEELRLIVREATRAGATASTPRPTFAELARENARLAACIAALEQRQEELLRLNGLLRELCTTDDLTGLKNHRAFCEQAQGAFEVAGRYQSPLSLVILDIDHFKRFNDAHGHLVGDEVLKQVAEVLSRTIRGADFLARYGGEEFVVILPHTGRAEAVRSAERLRRAVETEGTRWGALTISAGVASLSPEMERVEELVQAADLALLRAKEAGRNRTAVAA
jgi:diguanylate cyclase (GGDEF)-like protein